jgi:type IX secretion system PorP/SprF family membrane protein
MEVFANSLSHKAAFSCLSRLTDMRTLLFITALIFVIRASAQDPFFTQNNHGWSMINPAYAGSLACARAEIGYRVQWPALSASYTTVNAAYDQYFSFGGVGFNYTHDRAGSGLMKTDRFDFNYSYPIGIGMSDDGKSKLVIQPGVQASYYNKRIDWNQLTFGSMIDPGRGFVYSGEAPAQTTKNIFDVSAGALAYTKRLCIGLAAFHLTQPDEGFIGTSRLPMRYVIHASGIIGNADADSAGFAIIPSVLYSKQGNFEILTGTIVARFKGISAGVGYRSRDAVYFIGGYTWRDFTISYSYDATISKLGNTGGSHEVHFGYRFMKDKWSAERRNLQAFM